MDAFVADRAVASPFAPGSESSWKRWRERKLAARPVDAAALAVEVRDAGALTRAERAAIVERCARANMAIYATSHGAGDPSIRLRLAAQLGLATPLAGPPVEGDGMARVPWHTEGYGNPARVAVRSWVMHCTHGEGAGEFAFLDPELAWLLLRDQGAAFVDALAQPDAFAIGVNEAPHAVFGTGPEGDLHMRFGERREALRWKRDAVVSEAAARLRRLLDRDTSCVVRIRLERGMGVVSNNALLTRSMAAGAAPPRMHRACFRERIAGTEGAWRALL